MSDPIAATRRRPSAHGPRHVDGIAGMATLSIHNLPADVHAGLRVRVAKHGRSMEAEAREILAEAVQGADRKPVDLAGLRAFMLRLYDGELPTGVVDEFIAERRRDAAWERGDV